MMGVELVEGRDLVCVGGQVRMRTTKGDRPVDVIYRRVDDEFLDPVHFRGDSVLGVAGLVSAMRSGRVTVANAIGNGVADDKLDLLLPARADPVLPRRGPDPGQRRHLPLRRAGGPAARARPPRGDGRQARRRLGRQGPGRLPEGRRRHPRQGAQAAHRADPRGWIAQPVVQLSTVPTFIDGKLAPRHVDLRPFAVNDGERVRVLPGGLTRVALPEGELVVNSSQGGGSKDTWVLSDRRPAGNAPSRPPDNREVVVMSAPTASHEDSMREQQQQQQQSSARGGDGATRAEPDRRVAVLDRPLHRARRRHRPHRRRAAPAAARGPRRRRGGRRAHRARRHHGSAAARARSGSPTSAPRSSSTGPTPARSPAPCSPPARTPGAPARPSRPSCGRASTPRGTGGTASAAPSPPSGTCRGCANGLPSCRASPTRRCRTTRPGTSSCWAAASSAPT